MTANIASFNPNLVLSNIISSNKLLAVIHKSMKEKAYFLNSRQIIKDAMKAQMAFPI